MLIKIAQAAISQTEIDLRRMIMQEHGDIDEALQSSLKDCSNRHFAGQYSMAVLHFWNISEN